MRKKSVFVLLMLLALSSISLVFAGCDYSTGEIGRIDYDNESKTIFWESVAGADNYTVFENGKRLLNTNDTKFPVSALKEDVSYITVAPTKYMKDMGLSEEYLFITKGYEKIEYTILEDQSGYHAELKVSFAEVGVVVAVQSVFYDLPVKSVDIIAIKGIMIIPDIIEQYEVYSPNGMDNEGIVRLPQHLKELKNSFDCQAVQISKFNENFTILDGILYDTTMETLVYYPSQKNDTFFVVPESVRTILDIKNEYITDIKLPSNLKRIDTFPPNLKELSIPASVKDMNFNIYEFYGSKLVFEEGFQYVPCGFILENDCDVYIPTSVTYIPEELVVTNLYGENNQVTIHCAANEKPAGWANNWQRGCEVIWVKIFKIKNR